MLKKKYLNIDVLTFVSLWYKIKEEISNIMNLSKNIKKKSFYASKWKFKKIKNKSIKVSIYAYEMLNT